MIKTHSEKDDSSVALWLGKPAPRYTSYPPATAFTAFADDAPYRQALAALSPDKSVSGYVHVAFCHELCLYCGCNTTVTRKTDRLDRYTANLVREIDSAAAIIGHKLPLTHMHFGGGSPNILEPRHFKDIFAALNRCFAFTEGAEIASELDPRHVDQDILNALHSHGVNRISLGVQTLDPDVQKLINRIQPYEMVRDVCVMARATGITAINLDIMYGLPRQTAESVREMAEKIALLEPDRVALFSYAHVPSMKPHQKALEDAGLPEAHEKLAMEMAAREVLLSHGYVAIGMDHFAKPHDSMAKLATSGHLHRNFQGYTADTATSLISFGASSISETPMGYFQNARDVGPYEAALAQNKLPTARGYVLKGDDALRRAIIERLMCDLSCDVAEICAQHDVDPTPLWNAALDILRPMIEGGVIAVKEMTVRLTTPYPMAIRAVAYAFDTHSPNLTKAPSSRVA